MTFVTHHGLPGILKSSSPQDYRLLSGGFYRKNPIFELGIEKYLLERENRRKAGPPLSQDNDVVFALSQPMEISSRQSTGPTCANTMSGPPAPFNFGANLSIVDHDIISFSQPVFEKAKPTQAATFSYALDHVPQLVFLYFELSCCGSLLLDRQFKNICY